MAKISQKLDFTAVVHERCPVRRQAQEVKRTLRYKFRGTEKFRFIYIQSFWKQAMVSIILAKKYL